jgi:hypothetical protein
MDFLLTFWIMIAIKHQVHLTQNSLALPQFMPKHSHSATMDQNCCKKKLQLCKANQGHWFPDALST